MNGNQMSWARTRLGSPVTFNRSRNVADADSESVEELIDEGNSFEADAVYGVENAKDADVSEVTTRQVPEGDVPGEYRDGEDEPAAEPGHLGGIRRVDLRRNG